MKKAVKVFGCVKIIFVLLMFIGCQKENGNNNDSGGSGNENYDKPTIVSTQETNNNGSVIVEALFDDDSKMYFKLLPLNTAEVTNWKSFYGSGNNEGYVYRGNVVIPSEFTHSGKIYSIIGIQSEAFKNCTLLESIVASTNVKYIGNQTFAYCRNLVSASFDNPELGIGEYAFSNCSSLASFQIPDSTKYIGRGVFECCTNLTSITIPNSVKIIAGGGEMWDKYESGAFESCTGLSTVIIGNSVETIENGAFHNCSSLVSVTIPNSVKTIGSSIIEDLPFGAFEHCISLTSIVLGDSISFIGDKTFNGCLALNSIDLPSSVKTIGRGAFSNTGLNSIIIPNSVTKLSGAYAENLEHLGSFQNCKSLSSAVIGNSVYSLDLTFRGCSELKTITCYATTPPHSYNSFEQCPLTAIHVPNESIEQYRNANDWKDYADIIVGL